MTHRAPVTEAGGLTREIRTYFASNAPLIVGLVAIAIGAYGFELFSFNLTIDEELHASRFDPEQWVSQRRWGMYLLNRLLLPYTVVPVIPLAIGLVLHLAAVVLILRAWSVTGRSAQFLAGAVAVATPTMAYMYTFATISYGIGAGLFVSAVTLTVFAQEAGGRRYLAAIPGAIAIGIYQAFALALACLFVVWLVASALDDENGRPRGNTILHMLGVGGASAAAYYAVQRGFELLLDPPDSAYVEQFFRFAALGDYPSVVVRSTSAVAARVLRGDASIYAHTAWALPVMIGLLALGFLWRLRTIESKSTRALLVGGGAVIPVIPFVVGLVSGGHVAMRFLVALPFALSGLVVLGLTPSHRWLRAVSSAVIAMALIQFMVTTNSLFGSSHLALEQDRLLGWQIIEAIEQAAEAAPQEPRFLEIIGTVEYEETALVPQSETVGASFYQWEQGNVYRILAFLGTLGFHQLSGLPVERRGEFVELGTSMSQFPIEGSVAVSGDVVLVKLSAYSARQLSLICSASPEIAACK